MADAPSFPSSIPTLHGDRVTLRPFAREDARLVEALLARPEIAATTLNIPYPYPEGAALGWIATHPEQARLGVGFVWAIAVEGALVGTISIGVSRLHDRGTLGYWLGVEHWGKGYTSEAAQLVVAWGFAALQLHRIDAVCLPENRGSSRVMEKAGMTYEGTHRGFYRKGDTYLDVAQYAIIRPDLSA